MVTFLKHMCRVLVVIFVVNQTAFSQTNILRVPGIVTTASIAGNGNLNWLTDGDLSGDDYYFTNLSNDSIWIQFKLPTAQVATAFQNFYWGGGDTYGANHLLLYGSQDGIIWKLVSEVNSNPPPSIVSFDNTTGYIYYRFVYKDYRSTSYLDFYEIELYGNTIDAPVLNGISPQGTRINLNWNNTVFGNGRYELHRSTDGTNFTLLNSINTPENTYADNGLTQSTPYWYKLKAIKGAVSSDFSGIIKVTTASDTLKSAPVLTATAGNIGTLVNVRWTINGFNSDGTFQLERSTDGINFSLLKELNKTTLDFADTTVQQSTEYWYRVRAANYTSFSPYSNIAKVKTVSDALINKPAISATPGNIGTLANVNWSLTGFNTAGNYELERSIDGISFTLLKTFAKTITNYADSSLIRSTSYWYRVRAKNYTSTSAYSNPVKVTTISDSLLIAPTLTALASPIIGTMVNLNWTLSIVLPGSFELEKSTDGTNFTLFRTFDKTITSYTDSTLTHNTKYWYRVKGKNAVSPSPYSPVREVTTKNDSLLVAPTLNANAPTGTQVNLSWSLTSIIGGGGGYELEISTNGTDFTLLGKFSKTTNAYIQESLTPNTKYWYRIRAFNYINVTAYSNIVEVTTNSYTSTPADITDDGGKLFVSADNSEGADGGEGSNKFIDNNFFSKWLVFNNQASGNLSAVYRPTGSYIVTNYTLTTAGDAPGRDPKNWSFEGSTDSLIWVQLDTRTNQLGTPGRWETHNFNIANPGAIAYKFYRILFTANNGANDGVRFQVAEWQIFGLDNNSPDIPKTLAVTNTTTNSITLGWVNNSTKPVSKFVLQRSLDGLYFNLVDTLSSNLLTYTDIGLYDSTKYYYRIQSLGSTRTAVSGWSNIASGVTKFTEGTPLTPTNLRIVSVVDTVVNLTWTDRSYIETGFKMERSIDSLNFLSIATLPANITSFQDATVWPGKKYFYRVAAINAQTSSGYSNIVTVVTTGANSAPILNVPLLVQNACSNTNRITGYIGGLIPGVLKNELTQQLRVTSVIAADTTSAKYFSSFGFESTVVNGIATYYYTGSGFGNTGDTTSIIVTIKDDGGTISAGLDSLQILVKIVFNPLVVKITADRDILNVPKYVTVHLTASTNYASTTPKYTWSDAPGIQGSRNNIILNVRPEQSTTYTVQAVNINGCTATASIEITPDNERTISNVLTPNGDGKNDRWIIWGITQNQNNSVKIFDRAGRLLFYQKNYTNNWDGKYQGKVLDEGAYYYVVDFGDGTKPQTGVLNIINDRK